MEFRCNRGQLAVTRKSLVLSVIVLVLLATMSYYALQWKNQRETAKIADSAEAALKKKDYPNAERLARLALERSPSRSNDSARAALYRTLGDALAGQEKYSESAVALQACVAIRQKTNPGGTPEMANDIRALGTSEFELGRYPAAEIDFRQSLKMLEETVGPDHLPEVEPMNDLAAVDYAEGKYSEAESLYRRATAICERDLGPQVPQVAKLLDNLGRVYQERKTYGEAERVYQQSLDIYEHGPEPYDHGSIAELNNLCLLYTDESNFSRAESSCSQALAILRASPNEAEVTKAIVLMSLGDVYLNESNYPKAGALFDEALPTFEESPGPNRRYLAGDLANLAYVKVQTHRYSDAEALYRRYLSILDHMDQSALPPATAVTLRRYASLLRKMQKPGAEEIDARADVLGQIQGTR